MCVYGVYLISSGNWKSYFYLLIFSYCDWIFFSKVVLPVPGGPTKHIVYILLNGKSVPSNIYILLSPIFFWLKKPEGFLREKNSYLHFIFLHCYNTLFIYGSYCRVVIKLWFYSDRSFGSLSSSCVVGDLVSGLASFLAALYALDLLISSALLDNGMSCFDYSMSY